MRLGTIESGRVTTKTARARILLAGALAVPLLFGGAGSQAADAAQDLEAVRLAAGWINAVLADVAASAEAVAREYASVASDAAPAAEAEVAAWQARAVGDGGTTGFRTWAGGDAEPGFQAPYPGIYSYGGTVTPAKAATLQALSRLVPW